ncbi:MAG: DNA primase [Nitrosopumilus sp.]|nr:DNA primase [Nitrosopumilus sp.]
MIFSNDRNSRSSNSSNIDLKESPSDIINEKNTNIKNDSNNSKFYYNNQIWLKKTFKKYYFNFFANIDLPDKINLREFGFRHFDDERMYRHLSFHYPGELYAFVLKFSPSDIYCSSSFYRHPTESMDKKEWNGSELIFDIDGKDLHLECALTHNYKKCFSCNYINNGNSEKCNNCNDARLHIIDIPCKNCIGLLKKEVRKLIKFLIEDFGIANDVISVYFSGNNGFHLHVSDKNYFPLLSNERSEISGYILGKGFKLETLGVKKNTDKKFVPLLKNKQLLDAGWRDRILNKLKISFSTGKNSDNNFSKQIEKLEDAWNCDFQQIVSKTIEELSVKIDPMVTMDIHRIFRLAGSLNSKSGLAKILCIDLDSFDPFKDACFFDKSKVDIISGVDISLVFKGKRYEVFNGLNHVPEYVAVYLISKGLANINLKELYYE